MIESVENPQRLRQATSALILAVKIQRGVVGHSVWPRLLVATDSPLFLSVLDKAESRILQETRSSEIVVVERERLIKPFAVELGEDTLYFCLMRAVPPTGSGGVLAGYQPRHELVDNRISAQESP